MVRLVSLGSFASMAWCAFVAAIVGCNDAGPPPTSPAPIAAEPVTTVVVDGGPATSASTAVAAEDPPTSPSSGDGGPDFTSCSMDSDCVAVPRGGCCKNGWLEAVNKQSVGAYNASFACEKKRRLCPQYRIVDRRQAICGDDTHKCQMVTPASTVCNGTGPNKHTCPSGTQCDATGHCAGGTAPTPTP